MEKALDVHWELSLNGIVQEQGILNVTDHPARAEKTYRIPYKMPKEPGMVHLRLIYVSKGTMPCLENGEVMGFDQICLREEAPDFKIPEVENHPLKWEEDGRYLTVTGKNFRYCFDTFYGVFTSLFRDGKEYLENQWNII